MSEFFSNLLDRHLGACNVVEPRGHWRYESEGARSAIPLPLDHYGTDETGDEVLERQNMVVRNPENHLIGEFVNSMEPQRINTEVKLPVDHTDRVDSMGYNLERQDDLIRASADDSILADANALETKPHLGTLVLRQQDQQPVKPNPVEQRNPKEGNGHSSERGYRFEGKSDSRLKPTLARLQGHQKVREAEYAEANYLDQSVVTRMDNAEDTENEPASQPLLVASLFAESEMIGLSDSDQERQHAFAGDNQNISRDGSLEPPTWFSDMQAEFNQRWKELSRKSQPSAPIINVTIGSIEVKATNLREPEQPRKQKKPTGVMSLDTYLRQRTRGGSR